MKDKIDKRQANTDQVSRREYQAPVLLHFGSVIELTKDFSTSCMADNTACVSQPGNDMNGPPLLP